MAESILANQDADSSEVFQACADLLTKNGWCQFALHKAPNRSCAWGALASIVGFHGDFDAYTRKMNKYMDIMICALYGEMTPQNLIGFSSAKKADMIARWNDRVGRTASDVISFFERLAEPLRSKNAVQCGDPQKFQRNDAIIVHIP